MAGKETRGAVSADGDLFRGRTWVLTPDDPAELETPMAHAYREWLERLGARIIVMDCGSVTGIGTHKELMRTNETYREIVYSQLSQEEVA